MGDNASAALAAMWAFVGIILILLGLRLYTRNHLIDRLGPDDYAYTISCVRIGPLCAPYFSL